MLFHYVTSCSEPGNKWISLILHFLELFFSPPTGPLEQVPHVSVVTIVPINAHALLGWLLSTLLHNSNMLLFNTNRECHYKAQAVKWRIIQVQFGLGKHLPTPAAGQYRLSV